MTQYLKTLMITAVVLFCYGTNFAGNPDRQGEAGAYELLLNPWARSAGFHTLNTSMVSGVEAMRLNVAGLSRINTTEVLIGHTRLFEGTTMKLNSVGISQRMGKSGAFGITLTALDFGDIPITTENSPGGTGASFSPSFFHMGFAYANTFANKVSVGILLRGISESISDASAFGFGIDAGVQYVTGDEDNFKFGISLRNIGSPMTFGGQGLSFQTSNPGGAVDYQITIDQRAATFELPSVLNIGASYDILPAPRHRITVVGNFTANSFSRDQVGGGLEYSFKNMFMLRGGYRYDLGSSIIDEDRSVYSGLSAGVTIEVPLKKESSGKFGVDYAFRSTNPFDGTHNITIRYSM